MMVVDIINCSVHLVAAALTWRNVVQVHRDKGARGVYLPTSLFFALASAWSAFFYGTMGAWFSSFGALNMAISNAIWLALAVFYRRRASKQEGREAT